ncbi:hypothetical protein SAFG77S_03428 [Streptomyces afghaniensis]
MTAEAGPTHGKGALRAARGGPQRPLVFHLRGAQELVPGYELICVVTRLEKVVSRV